MLAPGAREIATQKKINPFEKIYSLAAGTTRALQELDVSGTLAVMFESSKANAVALSGELPHSPIEGSSTREGAAVSAMSSLFAQPRSDAAPRVLYPASCRAPGTLQKGLETRGFAVTRLNMYDTAAVTERSAQELERALACDVVTVASPSALKAFVGLVGRDAVRGKSIACIGSTSGEAALKLGLDARDVFWDEQPGMEGFVRSALAALEHAKSAAQQAAA